MQRKNYILKTLNSKRVSANSKRSGFAMIMAISVIVVLSTIMALSISLTTQTTKRTTDLYIYEQAVLLSKSAAEFALLRISQAAPCSISSLNFTQDTFYNIDINMRYIYTSPSPCVGAAGSDYFTITTPESNGSVLMDITVTVDDTTITSEPIRFFRRSIQKL